MGKLIYLYSTLVAKSTITYSLDFLTIEAGKFQILSGQ